MRSIGREVSGLRGAISLFIDGYTDGKLEERWMMVICGRETDKDKER